METLNPEDNEAIQIQSVDNIVNEIREIADHLYNDVRNPEFTPQASLQSQKSPHTSQTQFFQPREATSEFIPQASMQSQKSHHTSQTQFFQPREAASLEPQRETPRREDDTLRRSGASGVNPSEISRGLSKLHARVDEVLRNASVGRNSHRLAESTVQAIKNRQSFTQEVAPSNYGSVPRAPMFQQNATSQYASNVAGANPVYHNPFAATPDAVSARPEQVESDRRPPLHFSQALTPNISQSSYLGTNPELIRAIKEGRNLRSSGVESANPLSYSNVPRSENDLNRNYQSSVNPSMNERPSSLQDIMTSASVTGNFPTASTSAGLSMSVSTPLLNNKPRYDRSKLDSIINGIKNRDSGGPSSSTLRTSAVDAHSLTQSQVNLPVSRHQKPSSPSFAPETSSNIPANIPRSPQYQYDSQVPSKNDVSSPLPTPQNRNSHSLYRPNPLSPQQFQGPQSFLSPTATNPFNAQPRSVNTLDEEEHTDYYGIFQQPQPNRRGSETKQRQVQPQRSSDYYEEAPIDYPREEFEHHPYQIKGYHQASRNPYQSQEREPTKYTMRRSATSKQELHSRGSARQERLAGRQPRIELKEEPRKRRLQREPQEGFFCGEVENDDESMLKDQYSTEKSQPIRARRRSYNQNQSGSKNQIPESHDACGGLEDDSIESLSSIHRDSPPQQRAHYQPAPRPLRRPSPRPLGEERVQEEYMPRNEEFVLGPRQRRPSIQKQEQPRTPESQQQTRSSRRNSRSKNRPALGGGEMVYLGGPRANEENGLQKRPAQSFGKEQRQGGSVPRRGSRERGNLGQTAELVRRDENISNRMPPRGYLGEEARASELLGSSGKKGQSQRKFMNNDEDISDFDFDVNKVENRVIIVEESPEVARKRRLRQSRADEDSVVRAFEHAKYDNSGRKSTASNVARGTVKTEMVNFAPKRKLYR